MSGLTVEIAQSNDSFIKEVRSAAYRGYSFVPLLGSGISAASGILTGEQFTEYLAWTLYRCVASPEEQDEPRWDLRADGWPQKLPEVDKARNWICGEFIKLANDAEFLIEPESIHESIRERVSSSQASLKDEVMRRKPPRTDSQQATASPSHLLALVQPLNWPLIPSILASDLGSQHNYDVLSVGHSLGLLDRLRDYQAPQASPQIASGSVVEKAIRSLHDWRATLTFLAALRLERPRVKFERLFIGNLDSSIIDWFNAHITKGRKPNLAHDMLAHLARPLRFRTLLSTNFDTLLEQSFTEFHHNLQIFTVSIKSGLPDARTVLAQDSLVKLHGELSDTRADFTLDHKPTEADIATFQNYINPDGNTLHSPIEKYILVAGASGRDLRIIDFLKRALDAVAGLRIFWICYSDGDITRMKTTFGSYIRRTPGCVVLTKTQRIDLLLYELYQKCTLSLPPGGFSFTFAHKVPPGRNQTSIVDGSIHAKWALSIKQGDHSTDSFNIHGAPQATFVLDAEQGYYRLQGVHIIDHANLLVQALENQRMTCIWLELADFVSPEAMLYELVATIALRRGFFQLQHAEFVSRDIPFPDDESVKRLRTLLVEVLGIRPENWVLLLYGRTVPGASSGWMGNRWTDIQYKRLKVILQILGCPKVEPYRTLSLQFRIIYMPLNKERCEHEKNLEQQIIEHIRAKAGRIECDSYRSLCEIKKESIPGVMSDYSAYHAENNACIASSENVDKNVGIGTPEFKTPGDPRCLPYLYNRWLYPSEDIGKLIAVPGRTGKMEAASMAKFQFLYGLLLFRQSRHPNAVLTEAVYRCPFRFNRDRIDNDWVRSQQADDWMTDLKETNTFLDKPGGYAWIYRDLRVNLLRAIEFQTDLRTIVHGRERHYEFMGQQRGGMHNVIADWYFIAFCGTGHITPLLESMYHRFQAMRFMRFEKRWQRKVDSDYQQILEDRFLDYHEALNMLFKTIKLSKTSLNFWLSEPSAVECLKFPATLNETEGEYKTFPDFDAQQMDAYKSLGEPFAKLAVKFERRIKHLRFETEKAIDETITVAGGAENTRNFPTFLHSALAGTDVHQSDHPPISSYFTTDISTKNLQGENFRKRLLDALEADGLEFKCFDLGQYAERTSLPNGIDYWLVQLAEQIAGRRREWVWLHVADQPKICAVAQLLAEFAYLHVRRAKLEAHAVEKHDSSERWLEVCVICNEALAMCVHIDAAFLQFESFLQIKLLTLYGFALGHLGRYFESHRRLNEAEALLGKISLVADPLELAKIKLRRAEVYLSEAHEASLLAELGNGESNSGLIEKLITTNGLNTAEVVMPVDKASHAARVQSAKIDDAWILLEQAKLLLSGKSHSSLWWGRWITLSLRAFALCKSTRYDSLPLIRVVNARAYISTLFTSGRLISDKNIYFHLRLIDYYTQAASTIADRLGISRKAVERADLFGEANMHFEYIKSHWCPNYVLDAETLLGKYIIRIEGNLVAEIPPTSRWRTRPSIAVP